MENTSQQAGEGKKLLKPNNIIVVPTSVHTDFFKWWCTFLKPFVKLTEKEIEVISCFLKQRWELSKKISDPAILDSQVMSNDTKAKVIEECGMTLQHFYVVMSNLRKNKVIINNTINPRLIPSMRQDDNGAFQLLILFKDNQKNEV